MNPRVFREMSLLLDSGSVIRSAFVSPCNVAAAAAAAPSAAPDAANGRAHSGALSAPSGNGFAVYLVPVTGQRTSLRVEKSRLFAMYFEMLLEL
jgi:hypothetical protein